MTDFLSALGLLLVIEGVVYAAAPNLVRQALAAVLAGDDAGLRRGGLIAATIGVALLWVVRG